MEVLTNEEEVFDGTVGFIDGFRFSGRLRQREPGGEQCGIGAKK